MDCCPDKVDSKQVQLEFDELVPVSHAVAVKKRTELQSKLEMQTWREAGQISSDSLHLQMLQAARRSYVC